jgi:hypothetical protein
MIPSDSFARCCAFGGIVVASAYVNATVAFAQENLRLVGDLGSIIGSAEPCGYTLNDDAVSAYIEANVPASDLSFADELRMNIGYKRGLAAEMSGLELRVFCEATVRAAESLGFLASK